MVCDDLDISSLSFSRSEMQCRSHFFGAGLRRFRDRLDGSKSIHHGDFGKWRTDLPLVEE